MADWKESHPKIDRSKVLMVYTGKPGCMCGCGGKYRYTKASALFAKAHRGYEATAEEINESTVTRVLNKMATYQSVDVSEIYGKNGDSLIYCVDDGAKRLAVYTLPSGGKLPVALAWLLQRYR